MSALDYPFLFTAYNSLGNSTTINTYIEVDVFVIHEGPAMRIQIPSIMFAPYSTSLTEGLDEETIASNRAILQQVAEIMNKFSGYQIIIEGHANHTYPTPAAREVEHVTELIPLSDERARAVIDYLVGLGVARSRLSHNAVGGSRPVASYEDQENWWQNRRAEFILMR